MSLPGDDCWTTESECSERSLLICDPSPDDLASTTPGPSNEEILGHWYPLITELAAAVTSAAPVTRQKQYRADLEGSLLSSCELVLDEQTLARSLEKVKKIIQTTQPIKHQYHVVSEVFDERSHFIYRVTVPLADISHRN